ncbi:MAG: class 1 fructose-bisphosphatase [Longimicrobiales bacterium]|nr:class 1 fructose-bisphosphatase [Longimicrobiales bacterium]
MSYAPITLSRHIVEQERLHPGATGAFTTILLDVALAAKVISHEVNRAGLAEILGDEGCENVHGEKVQKLDLIADRVLYKALDHSGTLACMGSEEHAELLAIPEKFPKGEYVILYDPLDGSSNIDVNVSIGTIFSVHRKLSDGSEGRLVDALQPGSRQVAAGYVLYGSSTMLVYTTGSGVHGFTLDPEIGEFVLSHPQIRIPQPGAAIYSVNEGYEERWSEAQREVVTGLKRGEATGGQLCSARYIGSMVADVHRTLLRGGLFMYPADTRCPEGKLRLLYEAAPMGFLVEEAGGRASTGHGRILDVEPTELHQRTPVYMGSTEMVEYVERRLARG